MIIIKGNKYEWELSDKPFKHGGNSEIFKANKMNQIVTNQYNKYVAKLFKEKCNKDSRKERFIQEIEIVKKISSIQGCVKYVDHGFMDNVPFYIMPEYNGNFVDKYLNKSNNNLFTKLSDFLSLLQVVSELHNIMGLAIRDIKPQNILINDKNEPVVADFGLALWVNTPNEERLTESSIQIGSQGYRPPEWQQKYPNPKQTSGDIWSLGRTLWAMIAGKHAPNNYENLGSSNYHLKQYINREIANIIQSIVNAATLQNPEERLSIDELIKTVKETQEEIDQISTSNSKNKLSIDENIKYLSKQLKNSSHVIDAELMKKEIATKLEEINNSLNLIYEKLDNYANNLKSQIGSEIGSFSLHKTDHVNTARFLSVHLDFNFNRNRNCCKYVTLKFSPSKDLEEHKNLSYILLEFHIGLTDVNSFYWLIIEQDQNKREEKLIEQIPPKALYTLVQQKTKQLDKIIKEHFFKKIEDVFL